MKKVFFIIITLLSACGRVVMAQESPPPSQYLKTVNAQFSMDSRDSAVWHFKGAPYGWERLGKYKDVAERIKISDSIKTYVTPKLLRDSLAGALKLTGKEFQTVNGDVAFTDAIRPKYVLINNNDVNNINPQGSVQVFRGVNHVELDNRGLFVSDYTYQAGDNYTNYGNYKITFVNNAPNYGRSFSLNYNPNTLTNGNVYLPSTGSNNGVPPSDINTLALKADINTALTNRPDSTTIANNYLKLHGQSLQSTDGGLVLNGPLYPQSVKSFAGYTPDAGGASFGGTVAIGSNISDRDRTVRYYTGDKMIWNQGADAASNYWLGRYNNSGVLIDTPLRITRTTGIATFKNVPVVGTASIADSSKSAASTEFIKSLLYPTYVRYSNLVNDLHLNGRYIDAFANPNTGANFSGQGGLVITNSQFGGWAVQDHINSLASSINRLGLEVSNGSFYGIYRYDRITFADNNGANGAQVILKAKDSLPVGPQNFYLPNKSPGNYTIATKDDIPGGGGGITVVNSFNGRTGGVTQTFNDVTGALGFTPENLLNKKTTLTNSATDYPTTSAVTTAIAPKLNISDTSAFVRKSGSVMTGDLILASATPTNPLSAAPKIYIDNLLTGITWKNAVRVKTIGNVALSGIQTIDGTAGTADSRVLVNSQTDPTQNGIWLMKSGAWVRATDADSGDEILTSTVAVTAGTLYKNTQWTDLNTLPPSIGSDAINYGQISGAGTYAASNGVDLTGNVFTLNTAFARTIFSATSPLTYNNTTGTFGIQNASASQTGALTAADWITFNSKHNAFMLSNGQIPVWSGSNLTGTNNLYWDATNSRLGIGTTSPSSPLHVTGQIRTDNSVVITNRGLLTAGTTSNDIWLQSPAGNLELGGSAAKVVTIGATSASFAGNMISATGYGHTIFNTTDQSTNYVSSKLEFQSGVMTLGTYFGGNTSARSLQIGVQNAVGVTTLNSTARILTINAAPTATAGVFDFTSTTSAIGNATSFRSSFIASNVIQNEYAAMTNINQSGTAGYNISFMNITENTVGSGSKMLAKWQVGGSDKFSVDNTGALNSASYTSSAGFKNAVSSVKTANYTTTDNDYYIQVNSTAGTFNVNLLTTAAAGTTYTINNRRGTANSVTIVGTINGATNYTLNASKTITLYKTDSSTNAWDIVTNN